MKNKSGLLRSLIGLLLGALLIFLALKISNGLIAKKEKPKQNIEKQVAKVYTQEVLNAAVDVTIQEKGRLQALRRVELYSEVQGILLAGDRLFKEGTAYNSGDILLSLDDSEFRASLTAQKSTLYNIIAQIMPDLKLDYPEVADKWESYLKNLDIQRAIPPLPDYNNDREKFFINSRNIVTTYYNIKNLEERLRKYTISAPYYGIVTEALVDPGTLVRPGQKLGTFISPSTYELPVSVAESAQSYLAIGRSVRAYTLDRSQSWQGKITRISPTIDPTSQGIPVFIQLRGKGLSEGMFLEAHIAGDAIDSGYEISRKLLVENDKTFVVEDGKLRLRDVDVSIFKESTAIITDLEDGTVLLQSPIPGAYDGMLVTIATSENN